MGTHFHVTTWALAIILLAAVLLLHKSGKAKGAKITHMILRVDFILILISGGMLLYYYISNGSPQMGEAIFKGIAGVWAIICMEKICINKPGGEPTKSWWIQLVIAIIITMALGFGRLPLGFA